MVEVDQETCIGCGTCVAICSDVFSMEKGKATVTGDCESADCCEKAAKACPVDAISV